MPEPCRYPGTYIRYGKLIKELGTSTLAVITCKGIRESGTTPQTERIGADGGESSGSRVKLWEIEPQKLATETGLEISVCHFPRMNSEGCPNERGPCQLQGNNASSCCYITVPKQPFPEWYKYYFLTLHRRHAFIVPCKYKKIFASQLFRGKDQRVELSRFNGFTA